MNLSFNLLISLLLAPLAAMATGQPSEKPRPNVLFIAVDDLRPELGCYGDSQAKTPHMDKLAAQGMRFDRAYCQVAVCGASRASLMTGILPTSERFLNARTLAEKDAPDAVTLPQAFREAGYTTLSNGKIFHHPDDTGKRSWSEPAWSPKNPEAPTLGLDPETNRRLSNAKRGRIFESPDVPDAAYPDGKTALKTIADLKRLQKDGKPFFLACGFLKPHMPFYAPKKYWDLYQRDEIKIADNRTRPAEAPKQLKGSGEFRSYHLADLDENSEDFHRMMRHGYLACTSYTDKLIGDVLAELERLDLANNTIVVLWGDHGWHLGEHNFWGKHNTMHLSTRIPLILKVPAKKPGSTPSLVESSDLFPTLCTVVGIKPPHTVQGRDFSQLLDQPGAPFREAIYNRFGQGDAIITERFNYTSYSSPKSEMLYDLKMDPQENTNIAGNPESKETLETMRRLLKQRQQDAAQFRDQELPEKEGDTQE
ncbi:MAG: sulfatase [Luteolibacter sp.]